VSYRKAVKIKRYSEEFTQDQIIRKIGDFGLKLSLYPFQVRGVLFLAAAKKAILADSTGLGKTAQVIGLIQLLEFLGKEEGRWIVVAPPSTLYQWDSEFKKFSDIDVALGVGDSRERVQYYISKMWKVLIISYQILWRDWKLIRDLNVKCWVMDDAHFFRNHNTKTAEIIKNLTAGAKRVVLATATPKQKSLLDLHSLLEALGLNKVFGTKIGFENRYCIVRKTQITRKDGRKFWKREEIGMRNKRELQKKLYPFFIKRTFKQVGEQLPKLILKPVWLDLSPKQKSIYGQLRKRIIKELDKGVIKDIVNKGFHSMIQVCASTAQAGLETDESCKLDAIEQFIDDKLGDEKVVIYSFYRKTVDLIKKRLKKMGRYDYGVMLGGESKKLHERVRRKFQDTNQCNILIVTGTAETGLNLQSARYLILVNLILNSQRMIQLIGRVRRLGSINKNVVVYPLLCRGTIEERLWERLKYESALTDELWGERSDAFPKLDAIELASLVRE